MRVPCIVVLLSIAIARVGAAQDSVTLTPRQLPGGITVLLPSTWISAADTTKTRVLQTVDTSNRNSADTMIQRVLASGNPILLLLETAPGKTEPSANLTAVPAPGLTDSAFEQRSAEQVVAFLGPVCATTSQMLRRLGGRVLTCDQPEVDRESGRTIAVVRLVRTGHAGFVTVWIAEYAARDVVYSLTLAAPQAQEDRYRELFRRIWRSLQIPP